MTDTRMGLRSSSSASISSCSMTSMPDSWFVWALFRSIIEFKIVSRWSRRIWSVRQSLYLKRLQQNLHLSGRAEEVNFSFVGLAVFEDIFEDLKVRYSAFLKLDWRWKWRHGRKRGSFLFNKLQHSDVTAYWSTDEQAWLARSTLRESKHYIMRCQLIWPHLTFIFEPNLAIKFIEKKTFQ